MSIIRKSTNKKITTVRTFEEFESILTALPAGIYGVENCSGDEIAVVRVCNRTIDYI